MQEIELRGMRLAFKTNSNATPHVVYDNFNLKIDRGSFTVLLGPSGCGKSTLLNIVNGLLRPTSADAVLVDGADVRERPELTREMAYVFQNARLLPWKTLRGNVEFGLKGLGVKPKHEWDGLIEKYFAMVGLSDYVDYYPRQVSGGMQQRAAIVRAWANEPKVLLMDEPFSHLDEMTGAALRRELIELWSAEAERRTVIFVTHNITEAVELGSDIVMLTKTPSSIYRRVSVDLPWPRQLISDEFFQIEKDLRASFTEMTTQAREEARLAHR